VDVMCYLCANWPAQKRANKEIDKALRVWRRKKCDPTMCLPNGTSEPRAPKGCKKQCSINHAPAYLNALLEPPKREKVWKARDFEAYQKRTRYSPVKGFNPYEWMTPRPAGV